MTGPDRVVPSKIETARLSLRPPTIADAPEINRAYHETFDDLHCWIDGAKSRPSFDETVAEIRRLQALFVTGRDYAYYAFLKGTGRFVVANKLYALDLRVPKYGLGY